MLARASFWYLDGVKRCDYCGKEYPDDAVVCAIGRNPLPELLKSVAESDVAVTATFPPPYAERTKTGAVYPEYRGTAGSSRDDSCVWVGVVLSDECALLVPSLLSLAVGDRMVLS